MVAFTATLGGYIWQTFTGQTLSFPVLAIIAVVFALVSGAIAYRGISGSTNTAIAINAIQLTALAAFTVFAIYFRISHPASATVHYEMASAVSVFLPHKLINVIYQSTIAILLLVGFESVTALGAEAKNPDKDIKRGILLSLGIQGIAAYLFEYFAANFAIGSTTLTGTTAAGKAVAGYAAAALDGAPIGTMVKSMVNTVFGGGGTAVDGPRQGSPVDPGSAARQVRHAARRHLDPRDRLRRARCVRRVLGRHAHPDHARVQHRDVSRVRDELSDHDCSVRGAQGPQCVQALRDPRARRADEPR
jgi:hypothetical protein